MNSARAKPATRLKAMMNEESNQSLRPPSSSTICNAPRPRAMAAMPSQSAWRSLRRSPAWAPIDQATAAISATPGSNCNRKIQRHE
ncbi:hypothetical protein D3C72_2111470 [compost metagenome]